MSSKIQITYNYDDDEREFDVTVTSADKTFRLVSTIHVNDDNNTVTFVPVRDDGSISETALLNSVIDYDILSYVITFPIEDHHVVHDMIFDFVLDI